MDISEVSMELKKLQERENKRKISQEKYRLKLKQNPKIKPVLSDDKLAELRDKKKLYMREYAKLRKDKMKNKQSIKEEFIKQIKANMLTNAEIVKQIHIIF